MKRFLMVLLAALTLTACTTTSNRTAADVKPASISAGAKVMVIPPDVELSMLLASGVQEPKAEWSKSAAENLGASIKAHLDGRGHAHRVMVDDVAAWEGREGQVLRLHEAVAQSVLLFNYGYIKLPTKTRVLDWTIGDGGKLLAEKYDADFALFLLARGSYSSGGRAAMAVLGAVAGVSVPLGGQQLFVQLVDLRTGRVVWTQVATAAPGTDMREAAGAASLIATMFKQAPL
jgi:hypothetical protein